MGRGHLGLHRCKEGKGVFGDSLSVHNSARCGRAGWGSRKKRKARSYRYPPGKEDVQGVGLVEQASSSMSSGPCCRTMGLRARCLSVLSHTLTACDARGVSMFTVVPTECPPFDIGTRQFSWRRSGPLGEGGKPHLGNGAIRRIGARGGSGAELCMDAAAEKRLCFGARSTGERLNCQVDSGKPVSSYRNGWPHVNLHTCIRVPVEAQVAQAGEGSREVGLLNGQWLAHGSASSVPSDDTAVSMPDSI